jgi:hypothetical protein
MNPVHRPMDRETAGPAGDRGMDMGNLRRIAFLALVWSAKKGFEVGDQLHHGWVLANSDRDVHF